MGSEKAGEEELLCSSLIGAGISQPRVPHLQKAGAVGLLQQLNVTVHLSPQLLAIITQSSSRSYSGPCPQS